MNFRNKNTLGWFGMCTFFAAISSQAQVLVDGGDVTGGDTYAFSINADTFSSGGTFAEKTNGAVVSATGVQYMQEGGGAQYIYANPGGFSGEFVMAWDFSSSGYRPTSVDLSNIVVLLGGQTIGSTYVLETSTDGVNYTPFLSLTADGNHQIYQPYANTVSISGAPATFYQKVVFTAPAPEGFNDVFSQWGRVDGSSAATQVYGATFTVAAIPEPSSVALLAGAGGVMLLGRRGRRFSVSC
jgi:hypothetical protein